MEDPEEVIDMSSEDLEDSASEEEEEEIEKVDMSTWFTSKQKILDFKNEFLDKKVISPI